MAERALIDYIRGLAGSDGRALIGIGDDCAALRLPEGTVAVVTIDSVIEGVHCEPGTAPEMIGRKAVSRALSDIAAMAADPLCTVAAASFGPGLSEAGRRGLVRALCERGRELGAPLIGGDVASGAESTMVTVTALGSGDPSELVRRSGAEPGDLVCVTGSLGGSILGRHLTFDPRLREAAALRGRCRVHAMIDISDGLSTDALHLADESQVGFVIEEAAVPVSDSARRLAQTTGRSALDHAFDDGEDYELLFCVAADDARRLAEEGLAGTSVSIIGRVGEGRSSRRLAADGTERELTAGGWEHPGGG
jgi:thiamine-monophosphate kinase